MKTKLKTVFKCTLCPRQANVKDNPRSLDGWQVVPRVICSTCNGNDAAAYLPIPAKEKGKYLLARKYEDS